MITNILLREEQFVWTNWHQPYSSKTQLWNCRKQDCYIGKETTLRRRRKKFTTPVSYKYRCVVEHCNSSTSYIPQV